MHLLQRKCVPCKGGIRAIKREEAEKFLTQTPGWAIFEEGKKIKRECKFKNFTEAMVFINKVADLSEGQGHHPDIHVFYSRVVLTLWTHAIGGLSENDFIMAAKINALFK